MSDDALLRKLAALPCWQGAVSLEPLKGGLTNLSFVAQDRGIFGGGPFRGDQNLADFDAEVAQMAHQRAAGLIVADDGGKGRRHAEPETAAPAARHATARDP